jgi:hypothetical protein
MFEAFILFGLDGPNPPILLCHPIEVSWFASSVHLIKALSLC